jgi:4-carboxymuconolactone decarboxylase
VPERPSGRERDWGGRLPLADAERLDDDQRVLDEQLRARGVPWAEQSGFAATTAEGALIGPFNAHVLRPGLARGYAAWTAAERSGTSLPPAIREVVILTVGVAWESDYEIYAHVAAARHVGLAEPVIDGLRMHRADDSFSAEELAAHRFTDQLVRTHGVDDDTYRAALETFGQDGVLDMVHLIGMYLATSALLNAFRVPAPPIPPPDA